MKYHPQQINAPAGGTRREFLVAMGAAIGCFVCPNLRAKGRSQTAQTAVMRFVQFNDSHVSFDHKDTYKQAAMRLSSIISHIARQRDHPAPDFALAVGDMGNGSPGIKVKPDNTAVARILRDFPWPMMSTPGNHDYLPDKGKSYGNEFGQDLTTYVVQYRGLLFVMINNSDGESAGTEVAELRNAEVKRILDKHRDVPKLIICHIPLIPFRDPDVLEMGTKHKNNFLRGGTELLDIIEAHNDTVIAVLNGHVHLTGRVYKNGIEHISVSGTAPFPCDYGEYAVYPDRIHVKMRMWGSMKDQWTMGDDHMKNKQRNRDSTHASHIEYVVGRQDEREFDILLEGRKKIPQTEESLYALNENGWVAANCRTTMVEPGKTLVENMGPGQRTVWVPFAAAGRKQTVIGVTKEQLRGVAPGTWGPAWLSDPTQGLPVLLKEGEKLTVTASAYAYGNRSGD